MRQRRWTTTLVVVQLALAPILLTGAGLMMRSVIAQNQIDPGVETDGLIRMRIELTGTKYARPAERARFYRQLDDRFSSSGDLRAALLSHGPFEGATRRRFLDGRVATESNGSTMVDVVTIGRGYFETMGTRAVRGRTFNALDGAPDLIPAIVNEKFVAVHSAGQEPLGRVIRLAGVPGDAKGDQALLIVGVSPDIRQRSTETTRSFEPIVYLPYAANPLVRANIMVRTADGVVATASRVRDHLRALDPDLPVYDISTYNQSLAQSDERMGGLVFGSLLSAFGGIALLLAMIGLYAVIAYAAAQRRREIGVRVALGARARQIGWLVTRRAIVQLVIGLSIGLAGAIGVGLALRNVLIGVSAGDPVTLLSVAGLLTIVTLIASFVPARRAMRLNPVDALRVD